MKVEPIFNPGDYIINRKEKSENSDIGIVKGITKKGYYTFSHFYGGMFKQLKGSGYELQVNYQKFYDLCTEDEKREFDKIINEQSK